MKAAAVALRAFLAQQIGLEGFFLGVGIVLLTIGSASFGPQWPYLVAGGMLSLIGLALATKGPR